MKKSDSKSVSDLQNSIVLAILDSLAESWRDEPADEFERIVIDIEHSLVDPYNATMWRSFAVVRNIDGLFEKRSLDFDAVVNEEFMQLLKAIDAKEGSPVGTCHLIIESSGTYKFWYDYRQPLTILPPDDGVIEGEEEHIYFFKNYHELYAEERRKRDTGENVDYIVNPIFNRPWGRL